MRDRIAHVVSAREAGASYREIVSSEPGKLLVEMLTEAAKTLDAAGGTVRRAEARALHDEGMTMDEIATLFGVTRQRVSALLRGPRPSPLRHRRWTDLP
jgi:DNA-directed RNA polymerase sigma subunit (sigma70/sigma32)